MDKKKTEIKHISGTTKFWQSPNNPKEAAGSARGDLGIEGKGTPFFTNENKGIEDERRGRGGFSQVIDLRQI